MALELIRRTNRAARRRLQRRRRGIVILIVISVLVLFMLMLVAFAVVSSHYRDSARAFAYHKEVTVKVSDSRHVIDDVLSMVLGEPSASTSGLWGHSLLADLYGESVNGVINGPGAANEGNGTFVSFAARRDLQQTFPYALFSNTEQFYVGCVLTMKDGPCAGLSTRVTHYGPNNPDTPVVIDPVNAPPASYALVVPPQYLNANHLVGASDPVAFRVEAFENGLLPQPGNRFVVNGKPFSGTGVGRAYPLNGSGILDVSAGRNWYSNDEVDGAGRQWALMPNLSRWTDRLSALRALYGGANEPWDTFDFQNMFLALTPTDPSGSNRNSPSYHRPELMAYWQNRVGTAMNPYLLYDPANAALLRQICMRPLAVDHPGFTGSNPFDAFSLNRLMTDPAFYAAAMANQLYRDFTTGAITTNTVDGSGNPNIPINCWDVDNDNDGVMDSIWIDAGLPVATAPDGRQYKPLVAILIRDQDGKPNANAVGTTEFLKTVARPETQINGPLAGNSVGTPVNLSRGFGVGAAEIQLFNMFLEDTNGNLTFDAGEVTAAINGYQRLLQGTATGGGVQGIPGRYGLDYVTPLGANPLVSNRRPGAFGPNQPPSGLGGYSTDPLSVIKTQGYGLDYNGTVFSNYATPSDVWGRGALALDYAGQPYPFNFGVETDWIGDGSQTTVEINDNPYEINLVDHVSRDDTPYTVAELETLLRRADPDASVLPHRLFNFLNPLGVNGQRRLSNVSALGSYIPGSRSAIPKYMRTTATVAQNYSAKQSSGMNGTAYLPGGMSILDIALTRIQSDINSLGVMRGPNVPPQGTPPTESLKQAILKQTMPFELFHGEPFNLNRPFGNGVDDNGNGVVDEPGEVDNLNGPQEQAWTAGAFTPLPPQWAVPLPKPHAAYPLNDARANWWSPPGNAPYNNPAYLNYLDTDPHLYARQLYARNLYCLLMLLCDPSYFTPQFLNSPETLNPAQLRKLMCRRLAQYAINVVDFRDADAIMTPFEYDEYPFDGWHVDGNLVSPQDENTWLPNPERGVVWGMEQQDLILKEVVSFHNRRVRDTAIDTNMSDRMSGDTDVDQLGLPQGSTFIELFCPRGRVINNPKLPVELYNPVTGQLDLNRMAPAWPMAQGGDGAPHPVWQIAISAPMNPDPAPGGFPGTDPRPNSAVQQHPDTFSLEPTLNPALGVPTIQATIPNILATPPQTIPIQRYVWLANAAPAMATGQRDNTFYAESAVGLNPGQYLVIAPRQVTALGSQSNPPNYFSGFSQQKIDTADAMNSNRFTIRKNDNSISTKNPPGQIQNVTVMIASADPPRVGQTLVDGSTVAGMAGWDDNMNPRWRRIGLNVTEPLPQSGVYYLFPTYDDDLYDDPNGPMNTLPDQPFDYVAGSGLNTPGVAGEMYQSKTYMRSHTMVLQRLANPLQGFHPVLNPYINIDWAENDTTVFAGDENTDRQVMVTASMMMEDVDPNDPAGSPPGMRERPYFATRQRGNPLAPPNGYGKLWSPVTNDPPQTTGPAGASPGVYFDFDLVHTLGYVNGIYDATGTLTGGLARPLANPPAVGGDPTIPAPYVGDPHVPFPWITWNNRPYANPHELLQVPTSSPQRIGYEFEFVEAPDTYEQPTGGQPLPYQGFFRHLPNFFLTTVFPSSGAPTIVSGDFYRLFDHVETPSPFVATERWYRPDQTYSGNHGYGYRAPFNHLSRFRDPGRININTVVDPQVWDAIAATYPDLQTSFSTAFYQLLQSRRGYNRGAAESNTISDMFLTNPQYPSLVSNPFRPADAFDLQPLGHMKLQRPVDATLLRGTGAPLSATVPPGAGFPYPSQVPLFNNNVYNITAPGDTNYFRATDRNSYFRHLPYSKLSNMLSATSNTFAVWVTVGYFEVTPNTPNPPLTAGGVDVAHPDGFQLGQEMLFDGVIRRPRAFFLIDRSIPVGFEPGETLNTDKCILLRRYLE